MFLHKSVTVNRCVWFESTLPLPHLLKYLLNAIIQVLLQRRVGQMNLTGFTEKILLIGHFGAERCLKCLKDLSRGCATNVKTTTVKQKQANHLCSRVPDDGNVCRITEVSQGALNAEWRYWCTYLARDRCLVAQDLIKVPTLNYACVCSCDIHTGPF